jgi:eukaryotic-like serine/threonine-protein kinase
MSPAVRADSLPRTFGRYVLFDLVGKGGMAEIYLARQTMQLGGSRLCVVKQILGGLAGESRFGEMLVREAKLAARLTHANVVQVLDLGREDDRLFISMEYVEGFDLNDLLGRCSRAKVPLPFELSVHVVREALRGLDYAHRRKSDDGELLGIVHRDVSPSNLLLSFDGEVKVCDFGIARANGTIDGDGAGSDTDEALRGKAGYMSPEQARNQAVDARADVFALGIVLWELVAGRRMYRAGEERASLLEQARRADVPELPERGLPEESELRAIIGKALATDRDARYPSAGAMLRDLDAYAARAKLMTSSLQLGDWLATTFGADIIARRRSRERAMSALEKGAPLVAIPLATASPAAPLEPPVADAPPERSDPAISPVDPRTHATTTAEAGQDEARRPNKTHVPAIALMAVGIVAIAATLLAFTLK